MSAIVMAERRGGVIMAYSDDDLAQLQKYPEKTLLKLKITGAKKVRAYRELCCYKGSCKYIANLSINDRMDTKLKVDFMTKVKLGFVESTIVHPTIGVQFIPKSLSYLNCDQSESHEFISKALDEHAGLAGILNTGDYVQLLREQR